ncbi:MAG TPA: hypothetical protein DCL77_05785 [Prolixibacteraceae bacterium]|jgi:hypothetical protein|nr:hypothetical protein [Prolixibacteraceae bacterium]
MKKQILLLIVLLVSLVMQAQIHKTVNNLTPGSLFSLLTHDELATINSLRLTGTIDARDFKTMRDQMPKLTVVDIMDVTIAEYIGQGGTSLFIGEPVQDFTYPANTIPYGAFYEDAYFNKDKNLSYVLLPGSITSIGNGAFFFCDHLNSINIPGSVTSIGSLAFKYCKSLTSITIPASVTSIGDEAFSNCTGLSSIIAYPTTPVTLSSSSIFNGVDKTTCTLNVPFHSLSLYQSANGWKDFLNIIAIPLPTSKTIENLTPGNLITQMTSEELHILERLTLSGTMDARDFKTMRDSMPNLSDVEMRDITIAAYTGEEGTDQRDENNRIVSYPANTIPICAFEKCDSLQTITLPASLIAIGLAAFEYCHHLTYAYIPKSVTSIGNVAFGYCTDLTSLIISSKVTTIGAYAFIYCDHLKEITLPSSVTSIGEGIFQFCTQLTSIIIPPSITTISDNAFLGCKGLKSVYIPKSIHTIGAKAFTNCDSLQSVVIPNSVTEIKMSTFSNCIGLESVILPASVTTMGDGIFKNCIKLSSITAYPLIPVALPSVDVFHGVDKTACTLYVPTESLNQYQSANVWKDFIKTKAIQSSTHKTISILTPGGLITRMTSEELNTIDQLTLSGAIDARDFACMRDSMPKLAVIDLTGVTIVKYFGPLGTRGQWGYDYPANITPFSAFENKMSLTTVTLPSTIHTIEIASFEGCSNLSAVNIPSSVTIIGNGAFNRCNSLTSVIIPNSVISIGAGAYSSCTGLKSVNLPTSVKTIDAGAFSGCTGLTSFTIPTSVTTIGINAFWGSDKITAFKVPASVTFIGRTAFSECTAPITVESENPNYSSLDGVLFNKAQTHLIYCPISKSNVYTIPSTVKNIVESAFSGCKHLTSVKLPALVDTIGISAFYNCTGIVNVNIPVTIKFIGNGAFDNCMSLSSINIPNTIASIEGYTFFRSGLGSITIPSSVRSIGSYSFYNCIGLKSINFPNSLDTIIRQEAFGYCTSLKSINLPDSVTIIENYAFAACCCLTAVTLPAKVNFIGDRVFSGCTKLSSITAYPKTPVQLPTPDVFKGVDKATCTLFVPAESLDLYKSADVWKDFLKIEAIVHSATKTIPNKKVTVWPNPAKDMLTINADKGVVSIFNAYGKLESTHSLDANNRINISSLASGLYVVVVNGERFKVIKK